MFSSHKTSKDKNKDFVKQNTFSAMPMMMPDDDADVNADADAEMPMPRFPNDRETDLTFKIRRASVNETAAFLRIKAKCYKRYFKKYFHSEKEEKSIFFKY